MVTKKQFPQAAQNQNCRTQAAGGHQMSSRNTHYDDDEFTIELRKKT